MKPYDKSNSFMRRVTKRVSELIPGTTWMNMLLGEKQSGDDPSSTSENDDQPPVKKLCTSNNTFTSTNNRTCVGSNLSDNHRNSHVNVLLPEISAVTCVPSTSRQSPKFISYSNSSLPGHDIDNRSSFKRKSDVDSSNIDRQSPKPLAFNFASSTPTLVTTNKPSVTTISSKRPLNSEKKYIHNEAVLSKSLKLINTSENESLSVLKHSTKNVSSPSFRWDTFVNYGELSERQKLFAQKSPLNCSQVMYGGSSACSNLSKILGNTPPIHRKAVIQISPTKTSEIRTTSSILLGHISTKDKKIEENTFIIHPKVNLRHKADKKNLPLKVETTIESINTTPEKQDEKSKDTSSVYSGRDISRKLRANVSKKTLGLKSEELEMPAKVDLPNISLSVPVLPSINLSVKNVDDEFTFHQPLTIEQFSMQVAEKACRKKQKMTLSKAQNINMETSSKDHLSSVIPLPNTSTNDILKKETVTITNNEVGVEIPKINDTFGDYSKDSLCNKPSIQNTDTKLQSSKSVNMVFSNSSQVPDSDKVNSSKEKLSLELKKWTCDTCWVSNDGDKTNCVACQASKSKDTQKQLKSSESMKWTCDACWVTNQNEIDVCVACQTQKPGGTKKILGQSSTWICAECWIKNKDDCTSCISCGTSKPGCLGKPQSSTQFNFGLHNNTSAKSDSSQFKFGFDSSNTDQASSQFKFGSTVNTCENGKSDVSTSEFKFGVVNNKTEQPLCTFKFGFDSATNQPEKSSSSIEVLHSNNVDQPSSQFKFGSDESINPEFQTKSGLNTAVGKSSLQFKFGSSNVEIDRSVEQNLATVSNEVTQSSNEFLVNSKIEKLVESPSQSTFFKFGDAKKSEESASQITSDSVKTNISKSITNVGLQNDDLSKGCSNKQKIEIKSINFETSKIIPSTTGNTNTIQLMNGHSHSNNTSVDQKSDSIMKTPQLFSFSSLAKQDQNLPDDQKKQNTFTFGSVINDNKSFVSPVFPTSSFPLSGSGSLFGASNPVFGTSNSVFGSGPTTSTPATLGSSVSTPKFSFGSIAPRTLNSFSKNAKDNNKADLPQTSSTLNSITNVSFSFGAQSPPVFSVANPGIFPKPVLADEQTKSKPNSILNQSSTKQTLKLDPNAPISINFTSGTTTQFTAKPEITEQPKRKILKPVRRIR